MKNAVKEQWKHIEQTVKEKWKSSEQVNKNSEKVNKVNNAVKKHWKSEKSSDRKVKFILLQILTACVFSLSDIRGQKLFFTQESVLK